MRKEDVKYIFLFSLISLVILTQIFALEVDFKFIDYFNVSSFKIVNPLIIFDGRLKNYYLDKYKSYRLIFILLNLSFIYLLNFKYTNSKTAYGTSKWSKWKDIKKENLLTGRGVVLGKFKGKILSDVSPVHLMMMAPTRMGKGINTVIPTLFSWDKSVIVNDIKGECWELTSGYRREVLKQETMMFNPVSEDPQWRYNPLDEIRIRTLSELEDIKVISQTLIDIDGKGDSDHWINSAINLLNGVILHIKYINDNASLSDVISFISNGSFIEIIGSVIGFELDDEGNVVEGEKYKHEKTKDLFKSIYTEETMTHPIVEKIFSQIYNTPDKERGSIISTTTNKLQIFLDPKIKNNTSTSDFCTKDLMTKKISLYLVTPPRAIDMTRPLARLIYTQAIYGLTGVMKFGSKKESLKDKLIKGINNFLFIKPEKNRLLFLIDEFPSLGNMSIFEKAMAYIAGYGLKVLLITQSINQLNKIYGKDNSILDNCHIQLYLTPNDNETPKKISELLGTFTEEIKNSSYKQGEFKKNISTSLISRPLMTVGEVATLPFEKIIIRIAGKPAIYGDKIFYFKEKIFKSKVNYEIKDKGRIKKIEDIEIKDYLLNNFNIPEKLILEFFNFYGKEEASKMFLNIGNIDEFNRNLKKDTTITDVYFLLKEYKSEKIIEEKGTDNLSVAKEEELERDKIIELLVYSKKKYGIHLPSLDEYPDSELKKMMIVKKILNSLVTNKELEEMKLEEKRSLKIEELISLGLEKEKLENLEEKDLEKLLENKNYIVIEKERGTDNLSVAKTQEKENLINSLKEKKGTDNLSVAKEEKLLEDTFNINKIIEENLE